MFTTLYDTIPCGTTANTVHTLYQVSEGADATHTKDYTNMRAGGTIHTNERFRIERVSLIVDDNSPVADLNNWFVEGILSIFINDKEVFVSPAQLLVSNSSYGGHYSQGTAADEALIGLVGDGLELRIPLEIVGGNRFRVEYLQGTALSEVVNVKCVLIGTLTDNS